MTRRTFIAGVIAAAAVLTAGCTGHSSGVTVQSGPTSASPSTAATSVTTLSAAPNTAATSSSPVSSPTSLPSATTSAPQTASSTSTLPVPKVSDAAAQAAVDAYMKLYILDDRASRDPSHADIVAMNQLVAPATRKSWDAEYPSLAQEGVAYRGATPNPRLKVQNATSLGAVLTSCPLVSKTDPYVEYYVATGKAVAQPKRTIPGPYERSIFMTHAGGVWRLSSIVTDGSRTCR